MKHNLIFSLLFPPRCIFCGEVLPTKGGTTCSACAKNLPYVEDDNILRKIGKYTCAVTFRYEGMVRRGIRVMKFRGCPGRARRFAPYLAQTVAEHLGGEFDAVTFVPIHPIRRLNLGLNHLLDESFATLDIFTNPEEERREHELQMTVLDIKKRFGRNAILKGTSLEERSTARLRNTLIGGHNGGEDE
jgi:predicted amidophosphoribosyltransferase